MTSRRKFVGMFGAAAACIALPSLARSGLVAFAAPDFPQTRKLHDELLALAEADLSAHGLTRQRAIFGRTFFVEAGGLMSYQEIVASPMRVWHEILRTILSGTPPGDIPVRRPREFELALNVAEAKRLGIALPPTLVKRADRVFGA